MQLLDFFYLKKYNKSRLIYAKGEKYNLLKLKNITKVYKTANEEVEALKGVSIEFRESEFVSILRSKWLWKNHSFKYNWWT